MAVRKGQVFVLTALIFSSLILLVGFSYEDITQGGGESKINAYFDSAKNDHLQSFNSGLEENYSAEFLTKKLYTNNRFIKRRSDSKGIDYRSVQVIVLPEKGELRVINYQKSDLQANISLDGSWSNQTVGPRQNTAISFKNGQKNIDIVLDNPQTDRSFEASSPRLLNVFEMKTTDETWRDYSLH